MSIWNFNNKQVTGLRLWKRNDGTYRVIVAGEYQPLLENGVNCLIHESYAAVFAKLRDQVTLTPTIIFDQVKDLNNRAYYEMSVFNTISSDTITDEDSGGKKVWCDRGYVFVTTELKDELIAVDSETQLSFTTGYSNFAG